MEEFHRMLVNTITQARLMCALMLLFTPLLGWWWQSAAFLAIGVLTDVVDGPLARKWGVTSRHGANLHFLASTLLTTGALLGVVFAGAWTWWVWIIVASSYSLYLPLMTRLHGRWLTVCVNIYLVAKIALLCALTTTYIARW
jgi:cardiolipin synthase (CMP-forming)